MYPIRVNGENLQSHLRGKTCSKGLNWLYNCVYEKYLSQGVVYPCPGAIYIYIVYDHYFQTVSSLKPLRQSKPNFTWSLLGKGERNFI